MVLVGGHRSSAVFQRLGAHLFYIVEGGIETVERCEERSADVLLLILVAHILTAFVRHEEAQQQSSFLYGWQRHGVAACGEAAVQIACHTHEVVEADAHVAPCRGIFARHAVAHEG